MAGADPAHGVMDPPARQPLLGQQKTLARPADQVGRGHPAVLEQDLGVAADVLAAVPRVGVVHGRHVAHDVHARACPRSMTIIEARS